MTERKNEENKDIVDSVIEGRKLDAYAELQTKEMHVCWMCDKICYKKRPVHKIGEKWICIDCLGQLKEALEQLKQWEEKIHLKESMEEQLDEGLGLKDGSEEE